MCIDYRELNFKIKYPDSYMLSRIDDSFSRANIITRLTYKKRITMSSSLNKQKIIYYISLRQTMTLRVDINALWLSRCTLHFLAPYGLHAAGTQTQKALVQINQVIVYGTAIDEVLENLETVYERIIN